MKTKHFMIIGLAILLSGCSASSSTTQSDRKSAKSEKRALEYKSTSTLMESANYKYTVRSASPTGGRTIQISSTYTMEVKDGIYKAYLPYFGRSFSASYGVDGGIEFEGEPKELSIVKNDRKQSVTVSFTINNNNDQYKCILAVGYSGSGTLSITSQKRQTISYYGVLSELTEN